MNGSVMTKIIRKGNFYHHTEIHFDLPCIKKEDEKDINLFDDTCIIDFYQL